MESGYPFTFVGIDSHCIDDYQKDSLIYTFESRKSHHQYVVRIERYVEDLHSVKFFDSTSEASTGDFSHISATYEPRVIFRTVVEIALDVLRKNRKASFLFIGAADRKDLDNIPTRRYRVYRAFLSDYDLRDWFETAEYERLSMFVLLNLEAMPLPAQRYELLQKIDQFVGTF